MDKLFVFVLVLFSLTTYASVNTQLEDTANQGWWSTYGYIIIGALILLAAIIILVRKQHRKFND